MLFPCASPSTIRRPRQWTRVLLCGVLALCTLQVLAAPLVAVSIRPLQHVATAVTAGIVDVHLAVAPNQDPHHLSLKPSERLLLEQADLVLWVGPSLELPLDKLVTQLPGTVLALQALDGISALDAAHGNNHAAVDPHLWLDTRHAAQLAEALGRELTRLDPDNALRYAENLERFRSALAEADLALAGILEPLRHGPWAVEHHAFRYLERQFALTPALQLRDSDNREAGVRSARNLLQAMRAANLRCIAAEPQVAEAPLRNLLGDAELQVQRIDILGQDLEPAADSYVRMMLGIAQALASCAGAAA